ncbi:pentatricopeptide repeat-containing protein At1g03100, mitochondrial-like isoform X1 [Zingiber officinale]|uniref:At1g68980-like TPR repeats domain-containing protein n=2 Tax=Zingiber officinale TaxID=94328 RepID=A0A8J5FXE7_ZINOF|nr:pentatricopeptide repeat-containing protein At1g03100, mitochondrial-like isoform X1 [Zingiber officinale]XP_042403857.1 pentatricopeptide repeat-containing protein At1g03100, mitochondrial-like isoform X1 [Zingiber officinale]XP_042403858.1 pentatricopeptide repeat-containing protein At1g03100, mitochondrial-like isoform X1 [Zingiber officinale]XP_042403859.1 pentatricopeptide repeat-containing protein At1g03100, mitochondrial-like isoform X1 [Zingiber officinale]XP_042403860.1 pentatricope
MLSLKRFNFLSSPCSTQAVLSLLSGFHCKVTDTSVYGSLAPLIGETNKLLVYCTESKMEAIRFTTWDDPCYKRFCTMADTHEPSRLALELEQAVDEQRFEDAWIAYEKHVWMVGLPRKSVLSKLIVCFTESFNIHWLNKAHRVVELAFAESRPDLLEKDVLIYLAFILSRSQLSILATNIVRKLVKMEAFPPITAWLGIIGHMCQTSTGTLLAAELIMEIGYLFKDNGVDPRNAVAFNIILTGCILFGTTRKAEQLLELMPMIGMKPNLNLLIVMAQIYEKNGRRDELIKLKRHVDESIGLRDVEFLQFYNCLLSCLLKFKDFDSAVGMVLDMLGKAKEVRGSLASPKSLLQIVEAASSFRYENPGHEKLSLDKFNLIENLAPLYFDFTKDQSFSRLEAEAKESLNLLSEKLQAKVELVKSEQGILQPTEKMYAKLVNSLLEADKISGLASFLIKASKEGAPVFLEKSAAVQVINSCISNGLLKQAHELLDEMRFSGIRVGSSMYSSLLKAYCKINRHAEALTLLNDARQAGIQLDSSCFDALIQSWTHQDNSGDALHIFKEMKKSNISRSTHGSFETLVEGCTRGGEAGQMVKLLEEIKDIQNVDSGIHDWNSVIHFFCKKRLIGDAQKALNKMKALGHMPNAQTYHSLVTAYAAIGGKYSEVTDLWGEMKILANSKLMKFDQELLDSLLYCFVRGGFFVRAMEVVEVMERDQMFVDKYKYRSLWLKYHRTLYKGKAPKVQTQAQLKRRESTLAFKKWIALT